MESLFVAYANPSVVATQTTGWIAAPASSQYPAIWQTDLPSGRHGKLQESMQYPQKQRHPSDNYVTQRGMGLSSYNTQRMQMPLVRMNPVDSTKVPVNGNIMRVVGRSLPEQYVSSETASAQIDQQNPAGDLIRDPVMRAADYDRQRFYNIGGRRVPDNVRRNRNDFNNPPPQAPGPREGGNMNNNAP